MIQHQTARIVYEINRKKCYEQALVVLSYYFLSEMSCADDTECYSDSVPYDSEPREQYSIMVSMRLRMVFVPNTGFSIDLPALRVALLVYSMFRFCMALKYQHIQFNLGVVRTMLDPHSCTNYVLCASDKWKMRLNLWLIIRSIRNDIKVAGNTILLICSTILWAKCKTLIDHQSQSNYKIDDENEIHRLSMLVSEWISMPFLKWTENSIERCSNASTKIQFSMCNYILILVPCFLLSPCIYIVTTN